MDKRKLLDAILPKLDRGNAPDDKWPDGEGEYWAICPFQPQPTANADDFSVSERGYKCFACGAAGGLRKLAEHLGVECCSVAVLIGGVDSTNISLESYAAAKRLPVEFLRSLGVTERKRNDKLSLRIPYLDQSGAELAVRYRIALAGDKFRWARGSKLHLYGLWLVEPSAADVILVEGESDTQTLLYHGIPALGVPGANNWRREWAEHLTGKMVFAWQESDAAGGTFVAKIGRDVPDLRIITAPVGYKDISACHIAGFDIPALVARLKAEARPWRELQTQVLSAEAAKAQSVAGDLLRTPSILAEFSRLCERLGLVGEDRNAGLLYLALTTRLLERPVSVAVKGPSAAGKSFAVETVLSTFPPSAYYALSSMSEHSLAYSEEPLSHRHLVLYEAAGMASDLATYLIRSLLSEGCIRYETVVKTADGLTPKLIERAGPTGLVITTTWASMHPENETRMLSLTVRDDREQTRGVLHALADRVNGTEPDAVNLAPWHAMQTWLELAGNREVTIPYGHDLAALSDPRAVRLRRDFGAVLALIRAHAILHQTQRERDARGRIVASLADYAEVYGLVIDTVSEGVQATVSQAIRETVAAVAELDKETGLPVAVSKLAERLAIDKGAASRRVKVAIQEGYLVNAEDKRGRPAKLTVGEPLPAERRVLPAPDELEKYLLSTPPIDTATPQHLAEDVGEPLSEREVFEL